MRKLIASLCLFFISLGAIAPLLVASSGSTKFATGTTALNADIQVVPNSSTALSSTDTYIYQIVVANVTGSAATFTMTDRATSPKTILAAVSIAGNTTYVLAFPEGLKMKGGIMWSSNTASALNASINARRI